MILRPDTAAAAVLVLAGLAVPAAAADPPADLTVRFEEGLGPDLFHVENTGTCLATVVAVTIDLSSTVGGLVFDTEGGGAGFNAGYPFVLREGGEHVTGAAGGEDGGRALSLDLTGLRRGDRVVFSIDVDDSLEQSPWGRTRIAGPEFDGGRVIATVRQPNGREETHEATFGPDGRAHVNPRNCAVS